MNEPKNAFAILRRTIGLRQREMAALLECSLPTIQAIEYGRLALSDKIAQLASYKTGVSGSWLRCELGPIVDSQGKPYTREMYEKYRAFVLAESNHPASLEINLKLARSFFLQAMERMALLFTKAFREKNLVMCHYKVMNATEELLSQFGTYKSLTREENDAWKYSGWIPDKPPEPSYTTWMAPGVSDSVGGEQMLYALNRFLEATDAIHQEHLKTANPPAPPPPPKPTRPPIVPELEEVMNRPSPYSPPVDQNLDD
jgi:DNA-binding XRE family transcriptional regulator